jgi:hypothetical protein
MISRLQLLLQAVTHVLSLIQQCEPLANLYTVYLFFVIHVQVHSSRHLANAPL